jgi:hypothetical protein
MKTLKNKFGGGKLASKISERLSKRSEKMAEKSAKSIAKSKELDEKSKTVASGRGAGLQNAKNFVNAERSSKRGQVGNAQQKRSERSANAAKFFAKRSELSAANKEGRSARKAHRDRKSEIRSRYR